MLTLINKTTSIPIMDGNQGKLTKIWRYFFKKEEFMTTFMLLRFALTTTVEKDEYQTKNMLKEETRSMVRVNDMIKDITEDIGEIININDDDHKEVLKRLRKTNWGIIDQSVIDFIDEVQEAQEAHE